MVEKKPRIVIIGAGMAGLTAANRLYKSASSNHLDLSIVEAGSRIGGRINSTEFCGDGIELGATWIHGIEGSPVYEIAQQLNLLESEKPWECMDGAREDPVTMAEGGDVVSPCIVESVSRLFENLMNFVQGKDVVDVDEEDDEIRVVNSARMMRLLQELEAEKGGGETLSVGEFLRKGLEAYWENLGEEDDEVAEMAEKRKKNWSRKMMEEGLFAMNESIQRTFTSADDLGDLDYNAEKEYVMCPGEEITIAKGYSTVVQSLASILPDGMIQFGRKVEKIEWQNKHSHRQNGHHIRQNGHNHHNSHPVVLHFSDGSTISADHVIVTVSLGVLKREISQDRTFFDPPLPAIKASAISRLGYGVVNKVFLQLLSDQEFPFLQMAFHNPDSQFRNPNIPNWIRRTSFLHPIYRDSRLLLSWFTGKEALELESLSDEEIKKGFSATVSNLLPSKSNQDHQQEEASQCNGSCESNELKFGKVLRSQWGSNPLFLGSYSYIAVGSTVEDMDTLAEPLPEGCEGDDDEDEDEEDPKLQILFAGEATHRTHYSTTHGAYFSGLREANRLLKHYSYYNSTASSV